MSRGWLVLNHPPTTPLESARRVAVAGDVRRVVVDRQQLDWAVPLPRQQAGVVEDADAATAAGGVVVARRVRGGVTGVQHLEGTVPLPRGGAQVVADADATARVVATLTGGSRRGNSEHGATDDCGCEERFL